MDDLVSALQQLRIDRDDPAPPRHVNGTRRELKWVLGVVVAFVLIALGAAGGWLMRSTQGVPARVAVARQIAIGPSGTPAGVSLLDASGYITAHRQATVSAKSIYRVRQILVQEGQTVAEGEILARLDDSNVSATLQQARAQLAQAEATLEAAKVAVDDAGSIYRRNQLQAAGGYISAQAFDSATATYNTTRSNHAIQQRAVESARAAVVVAERSEDDTIVRAPFAAVVTDMAAEPGEIVSPSTDGGFTRTGICTLVDMSSLEADVDVSENFINRVHAGQPAAVRLNAYPDWPIRAAVIAIIPAADRSKATVKVRVGLEQADPRILPSMGARVAFLNEPELGATPAAAVGSTHALALPIEAVKVSGDTGTVFVIVGSTVEQRSIRLGGRVGQWQTILSGLAVGTRVAVADFNRLANHAKVLVQE
jgi:RND family efflux transporter MFP subunit